MFVWSENKKPSLDVQVINNIQRFKAKKEAYISKLVDILEKASVDILLFKSTLGESESTISMKEEEKKFPKLLIGTNDNPVEYKLTNKDRKEILMQLEKRFDSDNYPNITCKSEIISFRDCSHNFTLKVVMSSKENVES